MLPTSSPPTQTSPTLAERFSRCLPRCVRDAAQYTRLGEPPDEARADSPLSSPPPKPKLVDATAIEPDRLIGDLVDRLRMLRNVAINIPGPGRMIARFYDAQANALSLLRSREDRLASHSYSSMYSSNGQIDKPAFLTLDSRVRQIYRVVDERSYRASLTGAQLAREDDVSAIFERARCIQERADASVRRILDRQSHQVLRASSRFEAGLR